jgi:hypothetical protein
MQKFVIGTIAALALLVVGLMPGTASAYYYYYHHRHYHHYHHYYGYHHYHHYRY